MDSLPGISRAVRSGTVRQLSRIASDGVDVFALDEHVATALASLEELSDCILAVLKSPLLRAGKEGQILLVKASQYWKTLLVYINE